MSIKAVGLFSGGLDSILAVKLMQLQNEDILITSSNCQKMSMVLIGEMMDVVFISMIRDAQSIM